MPRRRLTRTARSLTRAQIREGEIQVRWAGVRIRWVACVLALSAITSPAAAYVRSTVDGMPERLLFWPERTIPIELASASSMDVTPLELRGALDRSLATWTHAGGCTDMVLTDVGEALGTTTNLDGGAPDHHNRIVVRESDWPAILGPETIAITTVLSDRSTGAIVDADTDLNGVDAMFSASDPPPADHDDLQNTLTHELGHLLGFGHVGDPEATMFVSAARGETIKRDLAPDDVDAICETYTPGVRPPTTLPPRAPTCAMAPGSRPSPSCIAAALGLLALSRRRLVRARSHRAAHAAGKACGAT
jgi:hypothetical protein